MARKKTAEQLTSLHQEAITEFDEIQTADRDERMQCLSDRRFYLITGAQWEGPLGEQFENKPRFEFNKTQLAVIRIINEYRNNRITVDFTPKDGSEDEMAEVCDGLYRSDEKACTAEEAYDNAFEEGVGGGMGAWRLRACYEDEDDDENDKQRVVMERISDADSCVFFDLNAKRHDKADARSCYVLTPYSYRAYQAEWKDDPASLSKQISQTCFDWCTPDIVWVAEWYRVEEKTEVINFYRGLDQDAPEMRVPESEFDEDGKKEEELAATGFRLMRQKRVKTRVVRKYIINGARVLEDCGVIPGKCIPIIPFYAKRMVIDGVERLSGHVRIAKDAQRLNNMIMSWLAEMAARFDIEKAILTPEQIAGHAQMWAEDNIKKYPFLLINPVRNADGSEQPMGPVGYTKAPNVPPAMAALAQIAGQALTDLLGNQQAGEQMQPNLSGKAVEMIQQRLDMQVFIYMSNLARAMKRCGQVWLSMMKDIVVEDERKMKTIDANGEVSSVVMNQPAYDEETAETYTRNDLTKANFEVDVDVGPSSSSRRAATVRSLIGMKQGTTDPETMAILDAMIMMNLEGEGMSEARDFFRKKLVNMGVVKPTAEEARAIAEAKAAAAQQPPDAQTQALLGMAEESQAKAAKARADTVETLTKADLNRANTAKTYAEAMTENQDQQIVGFEAMQRIAQGSQEPAPPQDSGAFPV